MSGVITKIVNSHTLRRYFIGFNKVQVLTIEKPSQVKLEYKGNTYKAKSVSCGATFTFVVAHNDTGKQLQVDQEDQEIAKGFKEIMQQKGTLAHFFGLVEEENKGNKFNQMKQQNSISDEQSDEEESKKEILRTEEIETLFVTKEHFIDALEKADFVKNKVRIRILADKLLKMSQITKCIMLSDLEDLAHGIMADHCKVFAFGQGHKVMFAFQKNLKDQNLDDSDSESQEGALDQKEQNQYLNDIIVVSRPTAIKFPRHIKSIMSVACGSSHILALTDKYKLFSWGVGSYAALGFGNLDDVQYPRELKIIYEDAQEEIYVIACGKYHSMCLSKKNFVYSWGTGQGGRLGHGDEENVYIPQEVHGISRGKPSFIAAGETHSACITDSYSLYTWGSGQYGRLGHGFDTNEKKPKLVEDLDKQEIQHVSCGAFHTLCVNTQGQIFSFGHGKYGKLGVNRKEREGVFNQPQRTLLYKTTQDAGVMQDKNELIVHVVASYNHSLAVSKNGKVFTWGFSGKGVLGRQRKIEEYLPLETGYSPQELKALVPNCNYIAFGEVQQQDSSVSTEISQIACGSLNTVALTNAGEIYVTGSNQYGQLGIGKNDMGENATEKPDILSFKKPLIDHESTISLIKFPGESNKRIGFIACGGEHIFAISKNNELFGWGRNDEGQLGVGFLSDYVCEPQMIKDLSLQKITFVACGDNYSAVLNYSGDMFVTGNMDNGKLGLGSAWSSGVILNFTLNPSLQKIKYVTCGPNHMLAITENKSDAADARSGLYAWGLNQRGQLGLGNKEDQNEPKKIPNLKEKFKKVVCGQNFSMGLTTNNQVFFWGNFKYYCEKVFKDIKEPDLLKSLGSAKIKDIACSKYQCMILNDKGEIFTWGNYLKKKIEKKVNGIKATSDVKTINKFPNTSKFDVLMEVISTGPNHSAGISVKKALYCWGFSQGGRLGLKRSDQNRAKMEPVIVQQIMNTLLLNKEKMKEGREGDDDLEDHAQEEEENPQINQIQQEEEKQPAEGEADAQKAENKGNEEEKKEKAAKESEDKNNAAQQVQPQEEKKTSEADNKEEKQDIAKVEQKQASQQEEKKEAPPIQLSDILIIKEENLPKVKLNLISLSSGAVGTGIMAITEAHIKLQKILKKERSEKLEEDQIIYFDDEILETLEQALKEFKQYQLLEKQRKDSKIQMQTCFLQRILEKPIYIELDSERINKGVDANMRKDKKQIKLILTALHVHPCYLLKIFEHKLLPAQEFVRAIKDVYSYPGDKEIYLRMSIFQKLLYLELKAAGKPENVDFFSKESVIGKLFKSILKSQETNLDTLCSFGCHIVNKLLNKFAQVQSISQDTSFDVTDAIKVAGSKQQDADKAGKNDQFGKRAIDLLNFVEEIIKEMIDDTILYPDAGQFTAKKSVLDELEEKKQGNKGPAALGNDEELKLESLRFSLEISYLANVIQKAFRDPTIFPVPASEDFITSKVLGLIFGMLDKIWKDFELNLFPYVKQVKGLVLLEDQIRKSHMNNLNNVFHVISCMFKGQLPFQDQSTEPWYNEMSVKLNQIQQTHKINILQRIIEKNSMKTLSFKNFENLLLHSLSSEGHYITVRKKILARLITIIEQNSPLLTIIKPASEDPLYREVFALSQQTLKNFAKKDTSKKDERTNVRLKSRLLIEDTNNTLSRCTDCQCIISQQYASPDTSTILERYNPQDSQSLVALYCSILKTVQDITKSHSVIEQIEKIYQNAKKNGDFDLASKMLKFNNLVEIEVQNIMNKATHTDEENNAGQLNAEIDENKAKEMVFIEMQKQAEMKINERRTKKYDLTVIQNRITNILNKQIQHRVRTIKEKEFQLYKTTINWIQFGLANQELKMLAAAYPLKHMNDVIDFTTDAKMSQHLFKNLGTDSKGAIKSIIKKQAKSLMTDKIITDIKLQQLKPLIGNSEFVFLETEDQSISVKLIFRDKKFQLCGPPIIVSEAVLLNFSITQKELLDMRKQGKQLKNQRLVLAGAIEFDHEKLVKLINEMDRQKTAYLLNSLDGDNNKPKHDPNIKVKITKI